MIGSVLLLWGCTNYELVAAEATFLVEPVDPGAAGAHLDLAVPMRMELYGPEFSDGLTLSPFFGFVQAPVEAEVDCHDEVVLDASVSNDQTGILLTRGVGDFEGLVGGVAYLDAQGDRRGGSFEGQVDLRFPCQGDALVPHDVSITWTVDRSAPVPYNDVP